MSTPASLQPLTYGAAVPRKLGHDRHQLTEVERTLLLLGGRGFTDEEAAERLGVGHTYVRNRWVAMHRKLDSANKAHAVVRSLQLGEATLEDFT